ncbi:MAG: hypothetical protein ACJA06_000883 [Halocynthiibacter sp.]|jgi:hypothetical protein
MTGTAAKIQGQTVWFTAPPLNQSLTFRPQPVDFKIQTQRKSRALLLLPKRAFTSGA